MIRGARELYNYQGERLRNYLLEGAPTESGLVIAWWARLVVLLGLAYRFVLTRQDYVNTPYLVPIQVVLGVMLLSVLLFRILAQLIPQLFFSQAGRLIQVLLDVVFVSSVCFLFQDIRSHAFIAYLIPLLVAVHYLPSWLALVVWILTSLSYWLGWHAVLAANQTVTLQAYLRVFLPRLVLLTVVPFLYWLRKEQLSAWASEVKRLDSQSQEQLQVLKTLSTAIQGMGSSLRLEKRLRSILEQAMGILGAGSGSILLLDRDDTQLVFEAAAGMEAESLRGYRVPASKGIAGWVSRTGKPQLVHDITQDDRFCPEIDAITGYTTRSLLCVPLSIEDKVIGVLELMSETQGTFSQESLDLLSDLAPPAAVAIENGRLYEARGQMVSALSALQRVSQRMVASLPRLGDLLQLIVDSAASTIQSAERAVLHLYDPDTRMLHPEVWHGMNQADIGKTPMTPGTGVAGCALQSGTLLNVGNTSQDSRYGLHPQEGDKCASLIVAPMIADQEMIGTISVDSSAPNAFSTDDEDLLRSLAALGAHALHSAGLLDRIRGQMNSLQRLSEASQKLLGHAELDELLDHAVYEGQRIFDVEDCSLFIKDESESTISLAASSTIPLDVFPAKCADASAKSGAGLTSYVAAAGETLSFLGDQYKKHPAWKGEFLDHLEHLPSHACRSLLLGPLLGSHGNIVGVMKLENKREDGGQGFSELDEKLFGAFRSHVGIALERASLLDAMTKSIRQDERQRLHDDLHDGMSLIHALVMMEAERIREMVSDGRHEEADAALRALWRNARYINFNELGRLLVDLEDPMLAEEGLTRALRKHISRLRVPRVQLDARDDRRLPFKIEHGLYRIAQEALSNVAKHAYRDDPEMCTARLSLTFGPEQVAMIIEDEGPGFDVDAALRTMDSVGLRGMKRRAHSLQAELTIDSKPGVGTTVRVVAPTKNGEDAQ